MVVSCHSRADKDIRAIRSSVTEVVGTWDQMIEANILSMIIIIIMTNIIMNKMIKNLFEI